MDKKNPNVVTGFSRLDGYLNVLNRFGTSRDSSEAYECKQTSKRGQFTP